MEKPEDLKRTYSISLVRLADLTPYLALLYVI